MAKKKKDAVADETIETSVVEDLDLGVDPFAGSEDDDEQESEAVETIAPPAAVGPTDVFAEIENRHDEDDEESTPTEDDYEAMRKEARFGVITTAVNQAAQATTSAVEALCKEKEIDVKKHASELLESLRDAVTRLEKLS